MGNPSSCFNSKKAREKNKSYKQAGLVLYCLNHPKGSNLGRTNNSKWSLVDFSGAMLGLNVPKSAMSGIVPFGAILEKI